VRRFAKAFLTSFLSFPVAAFVSLAVLFIGLSSTNVSTVVEQGTVTGFDSATSAYGHSVVDYVVVPIFRVTLKIINMVQNFRMTSGGPYRIDGCFHQQLPRYCKRVVVSRRK